MSGQTGNDVGSSVAIYVVHNEFRPTTAWAGSTLLDDPKLTG